MALPLQLAVDWMPWIVSGVASAVASGLVALLLTRRGAALRAGLEARHRHAAGALARERAVLRAVLEAMEEGVIVADPDGRFVVFNPAARRVIGREPADVTPDQWPETYRAFHSDMKTPLQKEELILAKAIRGEEPDPIDAYFRHDRGAGVHVHAKARPIRDESGGLLGGVVVMHDTTERRRAEAEREELISDLERRNQELDRFTYTVSHELRSPLVTIRGFLGLLRQDAEEDDRQRLTADMDRIAEAVETMSGLLEDLLELSRSGVVVDAAGTVDLGELVDEVVRVLDGPIRQAGAEVEVAEAFPTVRGDRRRLFEVFQNLIENALKFMGDQPSPRIEIDVREDETGTVCCVRDNGVGISEEHRERVFRIFERLDTSVEGTGVGLALVKGIIEAHRGVVWVEAGEGGIGSTFCFSLPIVADQ